MPAFAYAVRLLAAAFLAFTATSAPAVGFHRVYVPDPNGKPLEVGIWYPSRDVARPLVLGPTTMTVAPDGAVDGNALPLVLMSHGSGGSDLGHFDTALALAGAGYVVAAVTHTGDHHADQSRSLFVMDRPRHLRTVLDYLLSTWGAHDRIDPDRIGIFGFSAGGFTALVTVGGVADFSTVEPMCLQYPSDFACQLIARTGGPGRPDWSGAFDGRVRAAVVAAPALGFAFTAAGLEHVVAPVQLWRAENDPILPQPRYAEAVRLALPVAPDYHVVPGAGHFDFLAPCSDALAAIAPAICESAPGFDRKAFHQAFNAAVVGFYDRTLRPR